MGLKNDLKISQICIKLTDKTKQIRHGILLLKCLHALTQTGTTTIKLSFKDIIINIKTIIIQTLFHG